MTSDSPFSQTTDRSASRGGCAWISRAQVIECPMTCRPGWRFAIGRWRINCPPFGRWIARRLSIAKWLANRGGAAIGRGSPSMCGLGCGVCIRRRRDARAARRCDDVPFRSCTGCSSIQHGAVAASRRLLMSHLERAAWDAGWREVQLETHAGWSAAVAFYQSIGYAPVRDRSPR